MNSKTTSRMARLATAALLMACVLSANALPPAEGRVILTLSGRVAEKNTSNAAVFDLAMLEKLPQRSFTTLTPWYQQPVKFTGPLLRDVLAAAGAAGSVLKAVALNDYQTSIPIDDLTKHDVILAHRMNDALIPIQTKGPLFIVYLHGSNFSLHLRVQTTNSSALPQHPSPALGLAPAML